MWQQHTGIEHTTHTYSWLENDSKITIKPQTVAVQVSTTQHDSYCSNPYQAQGAALVGIARVLRAIQGAQKKPPSQRLQSIPTHKQQQQLNFSS